MAFNTLVKLNAYRKINITKVLSSTQLAFTNYDMSATPVGSLIEDTLGNTALIESISGSIVTYSNSVAAAPIQVKQKQLVTIRTIFRFSDSDLIATEVGRPVQYEGRLFSNSIAESLGSFKDKNQVISSNSIKLSNSDKKLTKIFHSYNLLDSSVDVYFGEGTVIEDYTLIFTGVTNKKSNFSYNDSTFSFSVKDNRSVLLSTPMTTKKYNADDFPTFKQYELGAPIAVLVLSAAAPAAWVPGTVITKVGGSTPVATVVSILGTSVNIYNYTGVFVNGDSVIGAGVTTTVSSVSGVAAAPLSLKGDTGHFIGNTDDLTNINVLIQPSAVTVLSNFKRTTWFGGFANYEPVFHPFTKTINPGTLGYLHNINMTINSSVGVLSAEMVITTASKTTISPLFVSGTGAVTLDLTANNIQLLGGPVTISIRVKSIGSKETNAFSLVISSISMNIQKRVSLSGSYSVNIPINFGPSGIDAIGGDGALIINRSDTNLVSVDVFDTTGGINDVLYTNANSGVSIPLGRNGHTISNIKLTITISASTNFLKTADILSTSIKYPTTTIIGSSLPDSIVNTDIPVIYGDFSTASIPTVRLSGTVVLVSSLFNFNTPTTGSLGYTSSASSGLLVGDKISYTAATSGESVTARVTQVLGTVASGTVYFENLGIVPTLASAISIERETNIYKVSDSPLHSIVAYQYKPKSAKTKQPLPATASVISENLANGEFTLSGISSVDPVFVKCTGKADANGVLIEDPETILRDIATTYLHNATIHIDPLIANELSLLKLRKYINNGETFGVVLQEIQQSTNTASHIDANNNIKLFKYNSTITPDFTFFDDEVLTGAFEEQYDPRTIQLNGSTFSFNFDPNSTNFLGNITKGDNIENNNIDLPWIYLLADANIVSSDIMDLLKLAPEIIHTRLKAARTLKIKLGSIIRLERLTDFHDIIVTQFVKDANKGLIDLYGWTLSDDYSFGYPLPATKVFPANLINAHSSVWNIDTYTMTKTNLMNKYWDNELGVLDVNMGFHGYLNPSNVPVNITSSIDASLNTVTNTIFSGNNSTLCFYTKDVRSVPGVNSSITLNISNAVSSAGTNTIKLTSALDINKGSLTGNIATDTPLLNGAITTINISAATAVTQVYSFPENSVLVLYITTASGTTLTLTDMLITNNVADFNATIIGGVVTEGHISSFVQWNPNWPFEFKDYIMERYMPHETLPNNTIVDINGNVEILPKRRVIQ